MHDYQLLLALTVLWMSTTAALLIFIPMWFANDAESFHPHSVDVEWRHSKMLVVSSSTGFDSLSSTSRAGGILLTGF